MKTVIEIVGDVNDGGAEAIVRDYAVLLKKKGVFPVVFATYDQKRSSNSIQIHNADIPIVSVYPSWNTVFRVINKLFGKIIISAKLKKCITDFCPDAIHIHMAMLRYLIPVRKTIKAQGIRLYYTCHSLPARYLKGKNKKEKNAAEILIKENDLQLIALHEQMREELNQMFSVKNTIILNNGVDFTKYHFSDNERQATRKSLQIDKDAFVVGHIGRFTDSKNHMFLIDVFKEVHEKKSNAFLLLIGVGELLNPIIDKLNSYGLNNSYMILSNRTDIPQLLNAMDVFAFPSKFEGLPLTLVEAQVAGLRCVVSSQISYESILSSKTIVCDLESFDKWVDAILNYELNNSNYNNIEKFDMNSVVDDVYTMYFGNGE